MSQLCAMITNAQCQIFDFFRVLILRNHNFLVVTLHQVGFKKSRSNWVLVQASELKVSPRPWIRSTSTKPDEFWKQLAYFSCFPYILVIDSGLSLVRFLAFPVRFRSALVLTLLDNLRPNQNRTHRGQKVPEPRNLKLVFAIEHHLRRSVRG